MVSSKILKAVTIGSALGSTGFINSNQQETNNLEMSEDINAIDNKDMKSLDGVSILNDAKLTKNLYSENLFVINQATNYDLNLCIEKELESIITTLLSDSENVIIKYIKNSCKKQYIKIKLLILQQQKQEIDIFR